MKNLILLSLFIINTFLPSKAQTNLHQKPPLAIILGVDCSLTVGDFNLLNQQYYEDLLHRLLDISTCREVYFGYQTIGNPTDRSLKRLVLKGPFTKKARNLGEALAIKKSNEAIYQRNAKLVEAFLSNIGAAPVANHQYTDLNGFFTRGQRFLNEPIVPENTRKIIFCYSDGIQDVKDEVSLAIHLPGTELYAAGWKSKQYSEQIIHLESPEGFLQFLTTLK